MACVFLDDLLKRLLVAHFVKSSGASKTLWKQLLGQARPLSTFSSRTILARLLGLIKESEFAAITAIRKIRNEFVHSPQEGIILSEELAQSILRKLDGETQQRIQLKAQGRDNATYARRLFAFIVVEITIQIIEATKRQASNKTHDSM